MFSTLLGALPQAAGSDSATTDADAAAIDNVTDLEATGLELLASGLPAAAADADPDSIVRAWRLAAGMTTRPVKQVLTGPYAAGRDGPRNRPAELGEQLRATIRALADAGCTFIEIEEPDPLAITAVSGERRRFVDAHERLLAVEPGTHVSLALGGGNLDEAGAATFFDLPYASYAFDLIAGPDNWRLIAAAPGDRGIVCGALAPRPDGDETRELLIWAAHYAASTRARGTDRVGLANAPSLAAGPRDSALRKLRIVAEATRIGSVGSAEEMARLLDPRAFGRRRNRPGAAARGAPAAETDEHP
jgi:methionine synthase II (cobalamin-independent)